MWSSSIEREEINELRVVLKAPVTKKNLVLFHLSKMNSPTLDTVLLGQYLTQTWTQSVNRHAWLSFKIVGALLCFSLVCNTINFSVIFSWGTSSSTCILCSTITFLGITAYFVVPFWSSPPNFYIVYVQDVISQWLLWSRLYFSINSVSWLILGNLLYFVLWDLMFLYFLNSSFFDLETTKKSPHYLVLSLIAVMSGCISFSFLYLYDLHILICFISVQIDFWDLSFLIRKALSSSLVYFPF